METTEYLLAESGKVLGGTNTSLLELHIGVEEPLHNFQFYVSLSQNLGLKVSMRSQ